MPDGDFENSGRALIAGGIAVALVMALLYLIGVPVGIEQYVFALAAFVGLGAITRRSDTISIGFVIISIGILAMVVEYLFPRALIDAFAPITAMIESFIGVSLSTVSSWRIFVLAVFFTVIMLAIKFRVEDQRVFADTITDYVLAQMSRYVDRYLTIGRLVVLFAFSAVVIAFEQSAQVLGTMGTQLAEAPLVVSNIFTGLAGYMSLGGELPIVGSLPLFGDLDAAAYLVFFILVLGAAAAARWRSTGPLAQFLRE